MYKELKENESMIRPMKKAGKDHANNSYIHTAVVIYATKLIFIFTWYSKEKMMSLCNTFEPDVAINGLLI